MIPPHHRPKTLEIVAQVVAQAQSQDIAAPIATDVAVQCTRLADDKDDCARLPIYSSGAETPKSTEHDLYAITELGKPTLVHRQSPPHIRDWLDDAPICDAIPVRKIENCDEYPFASMMEGGEANQPSLRAVPAVDNQRQGSLLWHRFYKPTKCNIEHGDPFLAIPSPTNTPTVGICKTP